MDDVIKRLKTELKELRDKKNKLSNFLGKADKVSELSSKQRDLLEIQFSVMGTYENILEIRIDSLENEQVLQELSEEYGKTIRGDKQ